MTNLDELTSTSSHELCEAITGPAPGQGWYDDTHGEIGDICAWQEKKLENYAVQLELEQGLKLQVKKERKTHISEVERPGD
jgi:hypothetical protein